MAEIQKRILALPQFHAKYIDAMLKRNALMFIKNWHDGIKLNAFGLKKLKGETIARKISMHMAHPEVPLYGRGDDKKDKSYVNMLRIKKIKKGWRVHPSWGKHYSANVRLDKLLQVHEYGALLRGANNALIRIPPRPALFLAYRKTMRDIAKIDRSKGMKKAVEQYVRTGNKLKILGDPINMLKPYKGTEVHAVKR